MFSFVTRRCNQVCLYLAAAIFEARPNHSFVAITKSRFPPSPCVTIPIHIGEYTSFSASRNYHVCSRGTSRSGVFSGAFHNTTLWLEECSLTVSFLFLERFKGSSLAHSIRCSLNWLFLEIHEGFSQLHFWQIPELGYKEKPWISWNSGWAILLLSPSLPDVLRYPTVSQPFFEEEITIALLTHKRVSVPGFDNITYQHIRWFAPKTFSALLHGLNFIWWT